MIFNKLPSNSKRLLDDLVNADNPTQYLSDRFDSANGKEDEELRTWYRTWCRILSLRPRRTAVDKVSVQPAAAPPGYGDIE